MSRQQIESRKLHPESWPKFAEIAEPAMIALSEGNGSGTKVYQSFLDGHPQLYMVPGYPLMYFYPHWGQWTEEGKTRDWATLIDAFLYHHPSLLDSREMPGSETLDRLGEGQNEWLTLDEGLFRGFLARILENQSISSRTFLLAVHYAYAFARGEDLSEKRALVFHIHVHHYIKKYLVADFPLAKTIAFTRDPRANCERRVENSINKPNSLRLRPSDQTLLRTRSYALITQFMLNGLDELDCSPLDHLAVVRHEDLFLRLEETMRASAEFMGVRWDAQLLEPTFGEKVWRTTYYDMAVSQKVNPEVVSQKWRESLNSLDWYVLEGLNFDLLHRYGFDTAKYREDHWLNRLVLAFAILIPSVIERREFYRLMLPSNWIHFTRQCLAEARGVVPLGDYFRNSFYRHKWTNQGLALHRRRFYVEPLRAALEKKAESGWGSLELVLVQALYVAAGQVRYFKTCLTYPAVIGRRVKLSFAALKRRALNQRVLPALLPPLGAMGSVASAAARLKTQVES